METGCRRAQAKVTAASSRKRPPRWLDYLERATEWVDVAPLPSPVAEAGMPLWAKDLLLARISRVPCVALLAGPGPMRLRRAPGLRRPGLLDGSNGLKRKCGSGDTEGGSPAILIPPPAMGSGSARPAPLPRAWGSLEGPCALSRPSPPAGRRFRARIRSPRIIPVRRTRAVRMYVFLPGVGR